ncbi:hypothetical protein DICVIV_00394 [Dictyocaulus viviparus]|uniref:Uncharacterized protein n=1 Tax=Dictyocaulus viviparus TaxID=29172 RepID=A0A0D8YFN1_DICVI|nr:hypothetical protein DICVIV_00394 [Dictyocaulus viviparus]
MSQYPYGCHQRAGCSYHHRPTCKFTQPSPVDSSCSSALAPPLTSPIGNPAIGNRLNPLATPGFGYQRGPLHYDLNPQYMGGARKTGGRRPKEFEMGPVTCVFNLLVLFTKEKIPILKAIYFIGK